MGVIYGIVNMLCKLCNDYLVKYSVCIFDVKGKIFCDDFYLVYKEYCVFMFDDLCVQIELIYEVVWVLGWFILVIEGVEVDDVIGILVEWVVCEGVWIIVLMGDKDFV